MICILHGYLLDGSGSNLWTRSVVRALCRAGEDVHLVCQEPDPAKYDFIAEAVAWHPDGRRETLLERDTPYPGRCVMHKPVLGDTLPVYVWDQYEEFDDVVPMTELGDADLETYLLANVQAVTRVVRENEIRVLHANHAVLMSVVARRVSGWTGVPYVVMPHGSALEYAVRPDERLWRQARGALEEAARVLVISEEIAERTRVFFPDIAEALEQRLEFLDLGVDTAAFRPVEPDARRPNVEQVVALLEDVERGRAPGVEQQLWQAVEAGEDVATAAARAAQYVAKHPDADVERKLLSIPWETDHVLAFVGRLIPAKGIHAVIGALPHVLAASPPLRIIVTGHGPLREPLELILHAMTRGDRQLARAALDYAGTIEAGEPEHLDALRIHWDALERDGAADEYWAAASRLVHPDTVLFTGYLTHREMSLLLPCCDAAVFPSMVVESGPLVFLEALASGVFPVGTYFGGMKVKIDRAAPSLEEGDRAVMRVSPEVAHIVRDLAEVLPRAVQLGRKYRTQLQRVAQEHYDWAPVARRLKDVLHEVAESGTDAVRSPVA